MALLYQILLILATHFLPLCQKLLNEYESYQIDLWVQNKVSDLIVQSEAYRKDLEEEGVREDIDDKIAKNFEIRWYINEIIDYVENNEEKLAYSLSYNDLNSEIREVLFFVAENKTRLKSIWKYSKIFFEILENLWSTRLIKLWSFKEKYKKELLEEWINISDESFYLKMKNEIFDLINDLNFEYIYNIQNNNELEEKFDKINEKDDETEINNANIELIFELIDFLYENKDVSFRDMKKIYFKKEIEYIKEFIFVNEENINLLMKNSIYYKHFLKIIALIDHYWDETIWDIEHYFWEELSENMPDKVIINKWYYDEMKAELHDLVKDLNNLIFIEKNS